MAIKKSPSRNYIIFGSSILIILILLCIITIIIWYKKPNDACPTGQVCLSQDQYEKLLYKLLPTLEPSSNQPIIKNRDIRVLNDQLYPPLNRTDKITLENVVLETQERNINVPTQDIGDTFHLIGYLTSSEEINKDNGGNSWKLMGRQMNRNESEFYLIPTNNNYSIKIPLTNDIYEGERLRDMYTIPKRIKFNSPLLNHCYYDFIEMPKTSFESGARYY